MADFNLSYYKTAAIEGGYSNDPADAGGETWAGISRRFHPDWPGWIIIDGEKHNGRSSLQLRLENDLSLEKLERQFYHDHYWNRFNGDAIPEQSVADELFDTAVHMGVHRAVGFLQCALNLLNRNQQNYADTIEDGVFGPETLGLLLEYLSLEKEDPTALLKLMNTLQGMHYVEYMRQHPNQEQYVRGWLKRT